MKHKIYDMPKLNIEISEDAHIRLLEIQLDMKKGKLPNSALNQIAAEKLEKALEKEKPSK